MSQICDFNILKNAGTTKWDVCHTPAPHVVNGGDDMSLLYMSYWSLLMKFQNMSTTLQLKFTPQHELT